MKNLTDRSMFKNSDTIRVDNIARVLLNDTPTLGLNLTLLTEGEGGELLLNHGYFNRNFDGGADSRIFSDVPAGQPMWGKITQIKERCFLETSYRYIIELHLHAGKDIDGGNWSRTDPNPPYDRRSGKVQPVA